MISRSTDGKQRVLSLSYGKDSLACLGAIEYLGLPLDRIVHAEVWATDTIQADLPPMVEFKSKADAKQWCIDNDLLSPIYTTANRGGCWFCHNQGIGQLRLLRKNYPELWQMLLEWDNDSPVSFKADGHTVHDFDRRFQLEDEGLIDPESTFRWSMLDDDLQYTIFKD